MTDNPWRYSTQGISVALVDVVTSRGGNLFDDLLRELRLPGVQAWPTSPSLYAVACRVFHGREESQLEAWPHALTIGNDLPTIPLWLTPEFALPIDLQSTYAATCAVLRIPAA